MEHSLTFQFKIHSGEETAMGVKSMSTAFRLAAVCVFVLLPQLSRTGDGREGEERLKRIIHETIQPKPVEPKPLTADMERLLAWSEPVNGLAARIELVDGYTILVRLKNTSQQSLMVPMGNPKEEKSTQAFEVHVRQGTGPWRKAAWIQDVYCEPPAVAKDRASKSPIMAISGTQADRPFVTLQPGEHCIAFVRGRDEQDDGQPKQFKVVLWRSGATREGFWTGTLETPPYMPPSTTARAGVPIGTLSIPEHFPMFTYANTVFVEGLQGDVHAVMRLDLSNRELLSLLSRYDPAGVKKEFERRMKAETLLPMKLLLAAVAARAGSEEAGLFLLETMKDTDYQTCLEFHDALFRVFQIGRSEPPAWVVELTLAVLSDKRLVTGMKQTGGAPITRVTVADCWTGNLLHAIEDSKTREAVPLLIERVKNKPDDSLAIDALAAIGDLRAIPVLMEKLEQAGKVAKGKREEFIPIEFSSPARALSKLKVKEAVPLLLQFVEYPQVIEDLVILGDPAVLPVLQEIVAAKGKIIRNGREVAPQHKEERLFAANKAFCAWDADGGITRLGEMLEDKSLDRSQRRSLLDEVARRPDPKSVSILIDVIKSNEDYYDVTSVISTLASMKYKAAVEGLIDCFDVAFKEENLGMGGIVTPATYRNVIARSLQKITGQTFGADKQQWLTWWQEQGQQNAELK
jgi:hypothetical protein